MYIPSLKKSSKSDYIKKMLICFGIVFLFLAMNMTSAFSNNVKRPKPVKVERKVEMRGNEVIIVTKTVFTKSDWKKLKALRKKNKKLIRKRN